MCAGALVYTDVCVLYLEARKLPHNTIYLFFFLRQGLSLGLEFTKSGWLVSPEILSLSPQCWGYNPTPAYSTRACPIFHGFWARTQVSCLQGKHFSKSSYYLTASGKAIISAGKPLPDLVKWPALAAGVRYGAHFPVPQDPA